jgi:hypothetical protein
MWPDGTVTIVRLQLNAACPHYFLSARDSDLHGLGDGGGLDGEPAVAALREAVERRRCNRIIRAALYLPENLNFPVEAF